MVQIHPHDFQKTLFFIGSDNIHAEREVKGFYTEFPALVRLFKEIFESIVRHHSRLKIEAVR
jgi:hypothetical protein